jgi:hypothetical protein
LITIAARKIATIERCVGRAREELAQAGASFRDDHTRQDAAVLNVTRACEAAIDLATCSFANVGWACRRMPETAFP